MSADLTFTAAMVQMRTGLLPEPSLEQGTKLIREAAAQGADYVLTPEVSNMMQLNRKALFEHLAAEEDDLSLQGLSRAGGGTEDPSAYRLAGAARLAREGRQPLVPDRAGWRRDRQLRQDPHVRYRSARRRELSRIRQLPARRNRRASRTCPGAGSGLTICYDVRFPALYRALAESGASFLTVPSAFTRKTGEAHWHALLRARAIENGCFVFAAAQAGLHENKRETYGHSLIVAPWGEILAEGGVEPGVFLARIDPAKVETARKTVPSLQHGRRFSVADPKAGPEHLHLVRGSA